MYVSLIPSFGLGRPKNCAGGVRPLIGAHNPPFQPPRSYHVGPGKAYQVDVTNYGQVEVAVNRIVEEFNGRLDIFIANSGIPWTQGPALDGDLEHYRKVVATDLDGTFYCARAAGIHWRRQKQKGTTIHGEKLQNYSSGAFVATASMSAHIVNIPQMQAVYNTAKAGVLHLCTSTPRLKDAHAE
jgi:sorbose reductase